MDDSFQRRVREAFSQAAPAYDANAQIQGHIHHELAGIAGTILPPGAMVLDLGSGTGAFAGYAAAEGHDWQIAQCDFAFGMCARAHARNPEHMAICAAAEALPFAGDAFDGVFSCLMLQWVEDVRRAFAEAARVTRPGGSLIAASFGPGSLKELKESFAAVGRKGHGKTLPEAAYLEKALRTSGWGMNAVQSTVVTEIYPEVWDLIRHLKRIGANQQENASPVSKEQLNAMADHYHRHFAEGYGIRCSWEVVIMLSTKL